MLSRALDVDLFALGVIVGVVPDRVKPGRRMTEVSEPLSKLLSADSPARVFLALRLFDP